MKRSKCFIGIVMFLAAVASSAAAEDSHFTGQFKKGTDSFGIQAGLGFTENIPSGRDRTDITFLHILPNYQYNLTGLMGDSWYQGAWYWHLEGVAAHALNRDGENLFGITPLQFQYKFLDPKRRWAPYAMLGGGLSWTNWDEPANRELGGEFQFLVQGGVGLEYFLDKWSYSLNYRMLHISNANTKVPNIGLNAHIFTLGFQF